VIPVGVDPVPQVTTKEDLAANYDLDPTRPLVVVPARLTPQKDPHLVLRALEQCPGIQVLFVGDGPLEAALVAEVAERSLSERVRFAGYVPNAAALLGACDAVVLGSRYEGHVLVGLEAMAAGTAFVATSCVGIVDWAISGTDCLLSPIGDADALAANLQRLLGDTSLRAHLIAGGRATAEKYSSAAMVAAHLALYDDLVSR
jgi:glycosyltransferase involved in cell wall biosynthesis